MAEQNGWIAIHRCLTEKAIWQCSSPEQKVILITLLMMANHQQKEWLWKGEKFKVKPGQFITSIESIKKKAGKGISLKNIRSALLKFEKLEFMANQSAKTGRLITIVNWEKYQPVKKEGGKANGKQVADEGQAGGKQVATNKNDKNVKNENKKDYEQFFETIWSIYPEKKGKGKVSDKTKRTLYDLGYDVLATCIDRYKKDKPDWKDYQLGSTFLYSGYIDYLDENYTPPEIENKSEYPDLTYED